MITTFAQKVHGYGRIVKGLQDQLFREVLGELAANPHVKLDWKRNKVMYDDFANFDADFIGIYRGHPVNFDISFSYITAGNYMSSAVLTSPEALMEDWIYNASSIMRGNFTDIEFKHPTGQVDHVVSCVSTDDFLQKMEKFHNETYVKELKRAKNRCAKKGKATTNN